MRLDLVFFFNSYFFQGSSTHDRYLFMYMLLGRIGGLSMVCGDVDVDVDVVGSSVTTFWIYYSRLLTGDK